MAASLLLISTFALAETRLSGSNALQMLAGKSFSFKCDDQMQGYGRFVSRASAWASYKYSNRPDDLERRSSAVIRVNGSELCFAADGGLGEICATFSERGAGVYRATSKDGWCDLRIGGTSAKN